MMTSCERCGFTPKNPRSLYLSALTNTVQCDNGAACKRRQERQKEKTS